MSVNTPLLAHAGTVASLPCRHLSAPAVKLFLGSKVWAHTAPDTRQRYREVPIATVGSGGNSRGRNVQLQLRTDL